jgi:putative FmdB family regulatory protein
LCTSCGLEIDIFQHYTDDTLQVCPECKQASLQKVYSPNPIHFKGDGWGCKDESVAHE